MARSTRLIGVLVGVVVAVACARQESGTAPASAAQAGAGIDRRVLPIADPSYPAVSEIDARKATPPARFEVKAPAGAPNVLLILLDDFGFGQASAFGGGVEMPALERLAANGLRYNDFHVPVAGLRDMNGYRLRPTRQPRHAGRRTQGGQPGGEQPREAQGTPGALPDRGGEVPGPAHR